MQTPRKEFLEPCRPQERRRLGAEWQCCHAPSIASTSRPALTLGQPQLPGPRWAQCDLAEQCQVTGEQCQSESSVRN